MANQRRPEGRPVGRNVSHESGLTVIIAGAVCLALGLAIGFYFGRQSLPQPVPATAALPSAQSQGTVLNPSAFLETEAALKTSLSANPRDLNTLIQLGNLYYDSGRYREAVES